MKTDRELVELAAIGAGIKGAHPNNKCSGLFLPSGSSGSWIYWDPLTDDGAALRLAVKLGLDFYQGDDDGPAAYAGYFLPGETRQKFAIVQHVADPYAATRRAIVLAAAAIGEGMADPTALPLA